MQSPEQQKLIIQRMIDAGEPEEAIASVIQRFKTTPAKPTDDGIAPHQARFASTLGDLLVGVLKEGGETAIRLGEALHTIPGVSAVVDKIYGESGLSGRAFTQAKSEFTQASNPTQAIGKGVGQIAGLVGTGGVIGAATRGVPRLAARVGIEAAGGAAQSVAAGSDPLTGGAISAAGPVVGAGVRGAQSLIRGARNTQPVQEAVEFGLREGIPVDVATASGVPALRAVQGGVDSTPVGGFVSTRAQRETEQALQQTGQRLASQVSPAPQTMESAGEAVQSTLAGLVKKSATDADHAYDGLRALEAKTPVKVKVGTETLVGPRGGVKQTPIMGTVNMAVNLDKPKEALRPLYERMLRSAELAQPMGAEARALTALDRLMNTQGSFAPLSVVDDALGDLKSVLRSQSNALGPGAGTLREIVQQLDKSVWAAAMKAGPQAVKALRDGRASTVKKYAVAELAEALGKEPVKVAGKITAREDTAIAQVRRLAQVAPEELPKVGRAFVDNLLEKASAEGGFGSAKTLLTEWERLGPETKKLLFKPDVAKNFDRFFLLAKKLAESPNPSGSTKMAIGTGAGLLTFTDPMTGAIVNLGSGALSKLLHSQKSAQYVHDLMTLPRSNPRYPGVAQQVMRLAGVQAGQQ